jgi:tRNA G18 (ribose-2'-O)-methylase SpoU
MYHRQPIESLDLPDLAPYRTMRMQHEHWLQRIFVAEGEKVVRRLLESHLTVVSMLLPETWFHQLEPLIRRRQEDFPVYLAEKRLLETLTGFSMYQGLLAVAKVPPPATLERALDQSPRPRLFVAVDGLTNAENLGALVRNCGAFAAQALVVGETCCNPYLRRAVRASMGAVFRLPLVEPVRLADALRFLRSRGVRCLAAHPHADRQAIAQANLAADCCLVFGSEGYGISPAVLEACSEAAVIPMPEAVDSLNVVSAAAVFLYEAGRQRGKMHSVPGNVPPLATDA